jgi:hypothetical protein
MTRHHRRWHAWLWVVLAPLLVAGFVAGLLARPTPATQPAPLAAPPEPKAVEMPP